ATSSTSRSIKPRWPALIFRRASTSENHSARSTSGNDRRRPLRGGHSVSNAFETSVAGSKSPATAQAVTRLPPACAISPSGRNFPRGCAPVSSANSRCATASGSSSPAYSPLGIDQAPRSFFAQNGPPGWTRRSSRRGPAPRYTSNPALRFAIATHSPSHRRRQLPHEVGEVLRPRGAEVVGEVAPRLVARRDQHEAGAGDAPDRRLDHAELGRIDLVVGEIDGEQLRLDPVDLLRRVVIHHRLGRIELVVGVELLRPLHRL